MQKEKLIIKNFGPIKEVDLDLGRFTILIGEQATGKSTVAKVLAVCRYFSYIVDVNVSRLKYDQFASGLRAWGLSGYLKDDTFIFYKGKHYSLQYERFTYSAYQQNEWEDEATEYDEVAHDLKIEPISPEFKNLLSELEKIKPQKTDFKEDTPEYDFGFLGWTVPISFFLNDVKSVMDNPFYFPTNRGLQSIFSVGKAGIQNLSDAFFIQLSKIHGIVSAFTEETYIEPLDVFYKNVRGNGYVRKASESEYYTLSESASGYQTLVPITLVIRHYTERKKKSKTLIIEEPELDIFPTAQDRLIQFVAEKASLYNSMVLMTTHSPYTLTSINNLMLGSQAGDVNPDKANEILDKKYWIDPQQVSCYKMLANGKAKDILDRELMQIDAGEIDLVSRAINKKWDLLSDIINSI